jgi:hypothetical protein
MTTMGYVEKLVRSRGRSLVLASAGLYPGVNYLFSCWYKRNEFGLRAVGNCCIILWSMS